MFTLIELIIALVVGLIIGWHVPQPAWVDKLIAKAKGK